MPRKTSLLLLPADRPGLTRLIFFVLGCLTTTSFAPFGLSFLLPLLLLPFLYVCLTVAPRDAGMHGFCFGFGLFLTGTYWIYISVVIYGNAPAWIALCLMLGLVLIMSAYFWLIGWSISRLSFGEPWLLLLTAPACWVTLEWLRGWLLSGFPWLALGYSQIDTPLAGWAPLLGVYGVSAMLLLSVAGLLLCALIRGRWLGVALLLALAPWIAGAGLKSVEWSQPAGEVFQASIIQGGISQDRKWLPEQREPTMSFYRAATEAVPDSRIVVWPEVAVPSITDRAESYLASIDALSRRNHQNILLGILERVELRTGEQPIYNSVLLFNGAGRQAYRKRHLVPFGEYFPVPPSVRSWLRMMNLPFSDLAAGEPEQPLLRLADGTQLGVAICYEDAYAAEQLYALPEAGLLINVSNDAWFGDSIAPHQHLEIARMRSLEVGRYTIRATNTGISAFIDADGKLLKSGAQFEPVSMTAAVQAHSGSTPYARYGNRPVVLFCLLLVAGFWLRSRAA